MQTTPAPVAESSFSMPLFLMIGSLTVFGPLCVDLYLPALPAITDDLHTSASLLQLSLTACLIGLGAGQLVYGSLSDQLGRRRPLFFGLGLFIVASFACAAAPNVTVLIACRLLQGLGGAAGIVVARAMVRDLYSGATAARFYSALMLVTGLGPILAPQLGAGLLQLGSWRFLFLCLAVAGLLLTGLAALKLQETLPPEARAAFDVKGTAASFARVGRDPMFLVNAVATAFGMGAVFAYIAGSSFVLENVFGLSPQAYGLVFAALAVGLVVGSQVNGRLLRQVGPRLLLTAGLVGLCVSGAALLLLDLTGRASLPAVLVCLSVVMISNGFVGPNALALAMNNFPDAAGAAAALVGLGQFAVGGLIAPLAGVGGTHDMTPMAAIMAGCGLIAVLARVLLRQPVPR